MCAESWFVDFNSSTFINNGDVSIKSFFAFSLSCPEDLKEIKRNSGINIISRSIMLFKIAGNESL
jgi:hypothetical protein